MENSEAYSGLLHKSGANVISKTRTRVSFSRLYVYYYYFFGPIQHMSYHSNSSNFTQGCMTDMVSAWKNFNVILPVNHYNLRRALMMLLRIVNVGNISSHTPTKLNLLHTI